MRGASYSREKLYLNIQEVPHLLDAHEEMTGLGPGKRPPEAQVFNKSAVVLISACWEAYCEDLCEEALGAILDGTTDPATLPKPLRKDIATRLKRITNLEDKKDKDDLAAWRLAGNGWRNVVEGHLASVFEERRRGFSNPKKEVVDGLFESTIGVKSLSAHWHYNRYSSEQVGTRLDKAIELRNQIVHRDKKLTYVHKRSAIKFGELIWKLAELTDGVVNQHVKKHTGSVLFEKPIKDESQQTFGKISERFDENRVRRKAT